MSTRTPEHKPESARKLGPNVAHNMASAAGARLVDPHFRNGRYTLHTADNLRHDNLTLDAVLRIPERGTYRGAEVTP